MTAKSTKSPASQLAALEEDLGTFWLVTYFPIPGTTTQGIHRRAKRSGQRAMTIHAAALASGDKETAKAAMGIAKQLVPYLRVSIDPNNRRHPRDVA